MASHLDDEEEFMEQAEIIPKTRKEKLKSLLFDDVREEHENMNDILVDLWSRFKRKKKQTAPDVEQEIEMEE